MRTIISSKIFCFRNQKAIREWNSKPLDMWIDIKRWKHVNDLIINIVPCGCALGIFTVEVHLFCSETASWIHPPFVWPSKHWVGKAAGAKTLALICLCVWRCAITQLWGYLCLTVTVTTEDVTIFYITVWCFFIAQKLHKLQEGKVPLFNHAAWTYLYSLLVVYRRSVWILLFCTSIKHGSDHLLSDLFLLLLCINRNYFMLSIVTSMRLNALRLLSFVYI